MNSIRVRATFLFLVAAATPLAAQQPPETITLEIHDEVLGSINQNASAPGCAVGPDNRRFACEVILPKHKQTYWNQLTGRDRARVGYVYVGDSRMGPYDGLAAGFPVFSRDGKRVAFIAGRGNEAFFVVDGEEWPAAKDIGALATEFFSPDGKRTAYIAVHGDEACVVLDGLEGKRYDRISNLLFSPDSKRIAYSASSSGKTFVVVDDKELRPYDEIQVLSLVFTPDSRHVAYAARRGEKWFVVVGEKESERPYDAITSRSYDITPSKGLVFSADGKRLAYAATHGKDWFIVVDGKEGPPYKMVTDPVFSPDGARLAYRAESSKKKKSMVIDGVQGPTYRDVGRPVFSPDGDRIAYGVMLRKDQFAAVVDGIEGKGYFGIGRLVFSPDGRRLVYQAHDGEKAFVVVDGVEAGAYDYFVYAGRPVFEEDDTFSAVFSQRPLVKRAVVKIRPAVDSR